MEFLTLGSIIIMLFGVWRLVPKFFAARCPICYARLESIEELEEIRRWQNWHVVWHRFFCIECGYRWRRIELVRRPKELEV